MMNNYGYEWIKAMAKEHKRTVPDLLVLARQNDPFFTGGNTSCAMAEWFADLWEQFGYRRGLLDQPGIMARVVRAAGHGHRFYRLGADNGGRAEAPGLGQLRVLRQLCGEEGQLSRSENTDVSRFKERAMPPPIFIPGSSGHDEDTWARQALHPPQLGHHQL